MLVSTRRLAHWLLLDGEALKMSAVSLFVAEDGFVFAGDGAAYDIDGRLLRRVTKLYHSPSQPWALGYVGMGEFGERLFASLPQPHPNFDILRAKLVEMGRSLYLDMSAEWTLHYGPAIPPARATLVLAGYSNSSGRFEAVKIHSSPKEMQNQNTLELSLAPAWTLLEVTGFWASSAPNQHDLATFGLDGAELSPIDTAARYVCALRASCDHRGDAVYGVGCFLELLVVTEEQTFRWLAHEWPDPIGEVIDPRRGEAMPASSLAPTIEARVR